MKKLISLTLIITIIFSALSIGSMTTFAEEDSSEPNVIATDFLDRFRQDATLVFDDEFEGDTLDETKWEVASGWGRVEETWGTVKDGNVKVEDGNLKLRAFEKVTAEVTNGKAKYKQIQSGEVSSKAAWGDGLIEIRAKLPKGKGVYPAIWTMGRDFDNNTCRWPWSGEIDIMEAVGTDNKDTNNSGAWQTLHTARPNTDNKPAGAAHVATGVGEYATNNKIPLHDDYHTFWLYFDKEILIIGVDDSMMTIKDLSDPNLACFKEWEQWLILGLQMGGLASTPERTDYSVWEMLIDYVRVYRFEDTDRYKDYKIFEAEKLRHNGIDEVVWALTSPRCVKNTVAADLISTFENIEIGTYDVYAQMLSVANKIKGNYDTYINGVKTGSIDSGSGTDLFGAKGVYLGRVKIEDNSPFDVKFKYISGRGNTLNIDKYMLVKTDEASSIVVNKDNCKNEFDEIEVSSNQELADALKNIKPSGTIKLISDITLTSKIDLITDVKIDLNGNTINTGKLNSCFSIKSDSNIVFQNGRIIANGDNNGYFNRFIGTEITYSGVCNFNNIDVTISAKKTSKDYSCAFFSYYYAWTDFTVNNCTFSITSDYNETEPILISQDGITYNNCIFNCNGGSPFRVKNGDKNKTKKTLFNNCTINNAKYLCFSDSALTNYVKVTLANSTLNNLSMLTNFDTNTEYFSLAENNTMYNETESSIDFASDMNGSFTVVCEHLYSEATCTSPEICQYCKKTKGESTGGHKPGNPVIIREADCYYPQVTTVTCTKCGEILSEEETAPIKGHSFSVEQKGEYTCTSVPYFRKTCKDCGYVVTTSINNGMTTYGGNGHIVDESTIVPFNGCKTHTGYYYTCKACGKENIKKIERLGVHELEVTAFTTPTSDTTGNITYKCKTCEYTKSYTIGIGEHIISIDGIKYFTKSGWYTTPYNNSKEFIYYIDAYGNKYESDKSLFLSDDLSLTTVTSDNNFISMKSGAAIRLNNISGIRFYTTVNTKKLAEFKAVEGNKVEIGTIIAPADFVKGELTHDIGENKYVDIPYAADEYYEDTTLVGSIVDIKPDNVGRKYIGRGYIKITNGENVTYHYATQNDNERSLKFVSKALKSDNSDIAKELYSIYWESVDSWVNAADWVE